MLRYLLICFIVLFMGMRARAYRAKTDKALSDTGNIKVYTDFSGGSANLMLSKQYPLFRFMVNLGCVADRLFSAAYVAGDLENRCVYTDWHHTAQLFHATELMVELSMQALYRIIPH